MLETCGLLTGKLQSSLAARTQIAKPLLKLTGMSPAPHIKSDARQCREKEYSRAQNHPDSESAACQHNDSCEYDTTSNLQREAQPLASSFNLGKLGAKNLDRPHL